MRYPVACRGREPLVDAVLPVATQALLFEQIIVAESALPSEAIRFRPLHQWQAANGE
jgi:hypothetical protein